MIRDFETYPEYLEDHIAKPLHHYAKYTVVLKDLLDDPRTKDLLDTALSTYMMYEPKSENKFIPRIIPTREELNKKLLNAYKYREIGFETVGRFIDELEIAMCEIMPYYCQIMFTQDQDYNIIYNVDYERNTDIEISGNSSESLKGSNTGNVSTLDNRTDSETVKGTSNTVGSIDSKTTDTNETSATVTNNNKDVHSDTPQGNLSLPANKINDVNYASDAKWGTSTSTDSGSSNGTTTGSTDSESSTTGATETAKNSTGETTVTSSNNTDNTVTGTKGESQSHKERVLGNYGQVSAQSLVERYRDIIVNIEQKIINDRRIKELFMQIF